MIEYFWAKTGEDGNAYHPLILHMLDVAACADVIMEREPETTRQRMAAIMGLPWEYARLWLLLLIASHDLGKACPGFQLKWVNSRRVLEKAGFRLPRLPDTSINHAFVSQAALDHLLCEMGWKEGIAALCADAVGCHHGIRATPSVLEGLSGNRNGVDEQHWKSSWEELFKTLQNIFVVGKPPVKSNLSGPDFMLLSGLASFADWIGSNKEWFPFGTIADCGDLDIWFQRRREKAKIALDAIGWNNRRPLLNVYQTFADAFPKCSPPRPLQKTVAMAVAATPSPCVLLVEAPMGEGKTEAAFYAHLELQRRFGHRGMYMALPTKATGNAMFTRTLTFLRSFAGSRTLDLQLLHGAAKLNDTFQKVCLGQIHDDEDGGTVRAGEWFTHKKRALLSEYGVGTIDQALLTILPVRHYFVRLWGLANRIVIFDEIHAYDAYTGTLLFHLIRWLRALGSSVVLLSATLPPEFRRRLAAALGAKLPEQEAAYPRLTIFTDGDCKQVKFAADRSRWRELVIEPLGAALPAIHSCLIEKLPACGFVGVIVNTVQRAQELYKLFGDGEMIVTEGVIIGKRLTDRTEIYLFHARYPAQERQKREDAARALFGKNEDQNGKIKDRNGRSILIATQVVEQSLDLDFDLLITDLAPIDLILQRAGRLWRHQRKNRHVPHPVLCVAGLIGNLPGSFGDPLWWSAIYREDILLRTWEVLKKHKQIVLPDEIDRLVEDVYEGVAMPTDEEVLKRLEKAEVESDGEYYAHQTMAHQAIIGLPDDGSWKDTSRFYLYDEDEPGVHRILKAQTRLGEDSLTVIPFFPLDNLDATVTPDFAMAKEWFMRAVSLARKDVVMRLRSKGIPDGWKKISLLRNCYPMFFDNAGNWIEDDNVKLDKELGIVYTHKEAQ
ncbi:MAG: CRISPR-associated helicase Cas3' [Candidatus Aureabacteria bacterium]|nr:CRISPR-associated helicase Cas3' [Candidatus Auribacterota bacterium]